MDQAYNAKTVEAKWKTAWTKNKIYAFDAKSKKQVYSIDTPPPTLSGKMHVGHAFSYAQGDFIARYKRMRGFNVFYPFGTDDNGLPTERLIEKQHHVRSVTLDREAFVKLCNQTLKEFTPGFVQAWKDLGISCDFDHVYSTISNTSIATSQKSFLELYKNGLVYQEESPISWCVTCQTAIAQAEFEDKESQSTFNDVVFKTSGKNLVIATTRPELLPACVAVFYHPEDKRYASLKGKFANVPLFDYDVPILPDGTVDPTKGTGIVMCCTFGDKQDAEWWRMYHLPLKVVFTRDGNMNEHAGAYAGLSIKEARRHILVDLEKKGLLKGKKQITRAVNVHDKCGTELEILKTKQWYIRVLDKKQKFLDAVEGIIWHPAFMKKRLIHWIENLRWDWCISRQRHFGVPFPLWHCVACHAVILADEKQLPVFPLTQQPKKACSCGSTKFVAESDVLDTWATSSLTPQLAMGWLGDPAAFAKKLPMTIRLQAHDIIRTWAFYTLVKSVYHHDTIPWKEIMISGFITMGGEKMSKSKGNVVDPLAVMNTYNADALRYWTAGGKLGEDMDYLEKDVQNGNKLLIKLWNASRFISLHLTDYSDKKPQHLECMDHWLLQKLNEVIEGATEAFDAYDYSKARNTVDFFFWHHLCDDYLEIVKDRLYNPDKRGAQSRQAAQYVLSTTLRTVLKLYAPFMPFVTEELYSSFFAQNKESIHTSSWPYVDREIEDLEAKQIGDLFVSVLAQVRKAKADAKKSVGSPIILTLEKDTLTQLRPALDDLQAVCKAQSIKEGTFSISFV